MPEDEEVFAGLTIVADLDRLSAAKLGQVIHELEIAFGARLRISRISTPPGSGEGRLVRRGSSSQVPTVGRG